MSDMKNKPIDRSGFGPGPWDGEPDRVDLVTEEGFPGLILRNSMGGLCGYLAVPPGHPWHGKDYQDIGAYCHGGLTYSGECRGNICHVPQPGEPDDVWWVGFDCVHSMDVVPSHNKLFPGEAYAITGSRYRDVGYVTREIESLARQAKAAG